MKKKSAKPEPNHLIVPAGVGVILLAIIAGMWAQAYRDASYRITLPPETTVHEGTTTIMPTEHIKIVYRYKTRIKYVERLVMASAPTPAHAETPVPTAVAGEDFTSYRFSWEKPATDWTLMGGLGLIVNRQNTDNNSGYADLSLVYKNDQMVNVGLTNRGEIKVGASKAFLKF